MIYGGSFRVPHCWPLLGIVCLAQLGMALSIFSSPSSSSSVATTPSARPTSTPLPTISLPPPLPTSSAFPNSLESDSTPTTHSFSSTISSESNLQSSPSVSTVPVSFPTNMPTSTYTSATLSLSSAQFSSSLSGPVPVSQLPFSTVVPTQPALLFYECSLLCVGVSPTNLAPTDISQLALVLSFLLPTVVIDSLQIDPASSTPSTTVLSVVVGVALSGPRHQLQQAQLTLLSPSAFSYISALPPFSSLASIGLTSFAPVSLPAASASPPLTNASTSRNELAADVGGSHSPVVAIAVSLSGFALLALVIVAAALISARREAREVRDAVPTTPPRPARGKLMLEPVLDQLSCPPSLSASPYGYRSYSMPTSTSLYDVHTPQIGAFIKRTTEQDICL